MNTFFSALTTTTVGMFDQDINYSLSLMFPQIYHKGIRQELYCNSRFWTYVGHAVYQSVICYFGVYFFFNDNSFSSLGYDIDASISSLILGISSIFILNLFATTSWKTWNWITHTSFWGSVIPFVAYIAIYSSGRESPVYGIFQLFTQPSFYCIIFLLIFVSLVPKVILKYYQREIDPNDTDILQEIQKLYWHKNIDYEHLAKVINGESLTSSAKSSFISQYADLMSSNPEKKPISLQIEKGDDGFGVDTSPQTSTNGIKSQRIQTLNRNFSVEHKPLGDRSRTSSSISVAFKSGVLMASQFMKKLKPDKDKFVRGASNLFFMGTNEEIPNTGFAFSHDAGMASIITPYRPTLPSVDEEREPRQRTSTTGSKFSDKASKQIRSISNSIKSALRISQLKPPSSNSSSLRSITGRLDTNAPAKDIPEETNASLPK
jgi:hypothetical protein